MPSKTAKERLDDGSSAKRVAILIYPGVTLLDATGSAQVFASANNVETSYIEPVYEVILTAPGGGLVRTDTGLELQSLSLEAAAARPIDTLIVAGGVGVFDAVREQALVDWVRAQSLTCRRTASSCMGSFLLAEAGLLDGQPATTHWRYLEELQRRHPRVSVTSDPLYVKSGQIWSSAGVTAGIDLALAMVEEDLGYNAAMQLAKVLVVFFKRPGGQSQFSSVLAAQSRDAAGDFAALHAWIVENLRADLSVEALAERAVMSPRSFARRYKAATGLTPAKSVELLRLDAAQRLLEDGELAYAEVAARSGFKDEQRLRRAFQRRLGICPSDYREKFGRAPPGGANSGIGRVGFSR
ncbi:MAG TPA: helix-turn-helix domain-containing protein [Kiloniellaceae bacterium]|nr:helix-turn-helix domain-containing protein [Kiloniellaceae bacterium]